MELHMAMRIFQWAIAIFLTSLVGAMFFGMILRASAKRDEDERRAREVDIYLDKAEKMDQRYH